MVNYIAFAIPLFFVFIGVELLAAKLKGRRVYRFNDAIVDLGCGIVSQVVGLLFKAALLLVYAGVWERFRLVDFTAGTLAPWLVAFVGVDFLYYWWHRASHEVNVLWAAHVVHHQSEDYNLAVALRQAVFTSVTSLPFYLPLAVLGVPPLVFITIESFSTLYQFWIHTELVRTTGPFEAFMNTPAHHRVHHAVNARYLDRNYGATLIVWDRLFRTFEPETEPPVYGISKPLESFNVVWANLHYWKELVDQARATPRLADKLQVFFRGPAWKPPGVEAPAKVRGAGDGAKFDPPVGRGLAAYVFAGFVVTAVATFSLLMWEKQVPHPWVAPSVALIVAATVGWGALFEKTKWAVPFELARLAASGAFGAYLLSASGAAGWLLALPAVAAVGFAALLLGATARTAAPAMAD